MTTFAPEDIKYFERKADEATTNADQEYYKAIVRTIKKLQLDDPYERAEEAISKC